MLRTQLLLWGCRQGSFPRRVLFLSLVPMVAWSAHAAAPAQEDGPYAPPDFESYFPDGPAGATALARLWDDPARDAARVEEVVETVRSGLRGFPQRAEVIRWLGNQYVWGQYPQHDGVIEIMYHAADGAAYGTQHYAVYFGLSVVREKSPHILRALAELCMQSESPDTIGRVAWGCAAQREALLSWLAPFIASKDESERRKAEDLVRIFKGDLKAGDWYRARRKQRAEALFSDTLPGLRQTLLAGDSTARAEALDTIQRESLPLIMAPDWIPVFAVCAEDEDPSVRAQAVRIAGEAWVWSTDNPVGPAIDLMLKGSADPDDDVQYNAVYFGLSTIRDKSEAVVTRLLELAWSAPESNYYGRIKWGLKDDRERVRRILEETMDGLEDAPDRARAAFEIYADFVGASPPAPERFQVGPLHTEGVTFLHLTLRDGNLARSSEAFARLLIDRMPTSVQPEDIRLLYVFYHADRLEVYLEVLEKRAIRTLSKAWNADPDIIFVRLQRVDATLRNHYEQASYNDRVHLGELLAAARKSG